MPAKYYINCFMRQLTLLRRNQRMKLELIQWSKTWQVARQKDLNIREHNIVLFFGLKCFPLKCCSRAQKYWVQRKYWEFTWILQQRSGWWYFLILMPAETKLTTAESNRNVNCHFRNQGWNFIKEKPLELCKSDIFCWPYQILR